MEIFRSREEEARREKISWTLNSIDDLLPQKDYCSVEKYISHSLAPRIRLAAYRGDVSAQHVLAEYPAMKSANSVFANFKNFSKKESSFGISADGEGLFICYDSRKFKVTNKGAYDLRNVEKPDKLFKNLLGFVKKDLLEGRKSWAEILKKRRQEFFQRNEVGEDDLLRREIETLVRWASHRGPEEVVLFAGEREEQDGKQIIPLYITADLRTAVNVRLNYEEVRGAMTTATDNEELDVDFGQFKFRINRIPGDVGEILNAVEETFSEFMKGNGRFGFKREAFDNFTLVGLDASYEEAIVPIFGEEKDVA